jgi:hypothetical protein
MSQPATRAAEAAGGSAAQRSGRELETTMTEHSSRHWPAGAGTAAAVIALALVALFVVGGSAGAAPPSRLLPVVPILPLPIVVPTATPNTVLIPKIKIDPTLLPYLFKPDLVVASLTVTQSATAPRAAPPPPGSPPRRYLRYDWSVTNTGNAPALPFAVYDVVDGGSQNFLALVRDLGAGQTYTGLAWVNPIPPATVTFTLVVDPQNVVPQSNESDKTRTVVISVK